MFTKAITRKPCKALVNGISTAMFGEGKPVYEDAVEQHDQQGYDAVVRGRIVVDGPDRDRHACGEHQL